jgi:hypothetical protein
VVNDWLSKHAPAPIQTSAFLNQTSQCPSSQPHSIQHIPLAHPGPPLLLFLNCSCGIWILTTTDWTARSSISGRCAYLDTWSLSPVKAGTTNIALLALATPTTLLGPSSSLGGLYRDLSLPLDAASYSKAAAPCPCLRLFAAANIPWQQIHLGG